MGEGNRGQAIGIMRANSDADVDRIIQQDRRGGKGSQLSIAGPGEGCEPVAVAFDAEARRAMFGGGDVFRLAPETALYCNVMCPSLWIATSA